MACEADIKPGSTFLNTVLVVVFVGFPVSGLLIKMGKRPPQSIPYLVSLLIRRILVPLVDVAFDWIAVAAYWREGKFEQAGTILAFLILGTLSLTVVSAFSGSDADAYKNLKTVQHQKGPVQYQKRVVCGCLAGLFQVGPIYLGGLAVRAWREVTDTCLRTPAGGRTSQAALEDYVALVAEVKHFIHFEALFEGGPQLILQTILIARDWDFLSCEAASLETEAWVRLPSQPPRHHLHHHPATTRPSSPDLAWPRLASPPPRHRLATTSHHLPSSPIISHQVRIISPIFSAFGLVLAQLDWLCEGDRFSHRVWQRDQPVVSRKYSE